MVARMVVETLVSLWLSLFGMTMWLVETLMVAVTLASRWWLSLFRMMMLVQWMSFQMLRMEKR